MVWPFDELQALWNQGHGSAISHTPSMSQDVAQSATPAQSGGIGVRNLIAGHLPAALLSRNPDIINAMNSSPAFGKAGSPDGSTNRSDDSDFWDYVYGRLDRGSSGGGVNIQAMIDNINQSYDRQRQAADLARQQSSAGIQNAYNLFSQNVARNYADYTNASQAAQAGMASRLAQQIADATARQNELQASAASMGQDVGALRAQQAGNLSALQTYGGFQEDLGRRLADIVANNQRSFQGSGELIRQGAMGNLENNYNALINALAAQREQQIMSAQSSGGGGGGSAKPTTLQDVLKEFQTLSEIKKFKKSYDNNFEDTNTLNFPGVSANTLFEQWLSLSRSDDENDRAIADLMKRDLQSLGE